MNFLLKPLNIIHLTVIFIGLAVTLNLLHSQGNPGSSGADDNLISEGSCYSNDMHGSIYADTAVVTLAKNDGAVHYQAFKLILGTSGLNSNPLNMQENPSELTWKKDFDFELTPEAFKEKFQYKVPCAFYDNIESLHNLHKHAVMMEKEYHKLKIKMLFLESKAKKTSSNE